MTYSIFFDESGKLDREQIYSYYGAFKQGIYSV